MGDKDQPLAVELHGQTVSITIGVTALKSAMLALFKETGTKGGRYVVPDEYALACQTVVELRSKGSDGTEFALAVLLNAASRTKAVVFERD